MTTINENAESGNQEQNYIKMDYSLQSPQERNEKVKEIIANTPSERLTSKYLEKLADYIIFAMDKEERKQKKILTDNILVTVKKREVSYEGLVGKLENGEDGLYNMIANDKNILFTPKIKITQKDLETIPGLKELRESIEKIEEEAKFATGKRKYLLKKQVIEMRRDQYVLKNDFKLPKYSKNNIKTLARLDLSENIWIDQKGEVHSSAKINLFEPAHVVAILCNYSELKMETWDRFDSDLRWLLLDLERIIDKALKEKHPLYYDLLIYKIDGKKNAEIQQLLNEKYNIKHSLEYISVLWRRKIPKLITEQATIDFLEYHYTVEEKGKWKKCSKCGSIKLAHNLFFSKNNTSKDHFYSICKECRNKKKR